MGNFFKRMASAFESFGSTKARVVMVGLDAAGKTTLLYVSAKPAIDSCLSS